MNAQLPEWSVLAPEERVRAEGMHNAARKAQYVAGHALLNKLRAARGVPLHTSLTHSGAWVFVAVSRGGPVGVDVELMRPDRPLERLSRRFFPREEQDWLARSSAAEQVGRFYALWTAKEALFKALGMPPNAAHFASRQVFNSETHGSVPREIVVEGLWVGWFEAAPGYLGAYAVPSEVMQVRYLLPA